MDIFSNLNDPQREAVNTLEGPILVLAGAGSGKTRVVTLRIINLLKNGVPPDRILGLTFTNKAAGEMRERVKQMTMSNVLICTFHSLGAKILRESIHHLGYQSHFAIYDEEDVQGVLKTCLIERGIPADNFKTYRGMISRAKNAMVTPDKASDDDAPQFAAIYASYQEKLKAYNAVDFDDLLYLTALLFREFPGVLQHYQDRWHYLLIDEYQDTNGTQYDLVLKLIGDRCNICVVGDPDQSIYSWRGAKISNILNFEKDFQGAKVIRLEQNYRSHGNILEAANTVIQRNKGRYEKNLWSDLGAGNPLYLFSADTERVEAEFIASRMRYHHEEQGVPFSQMVVFYRTNGQSRVFEDIFRAMRIPYAIVGGISFYQRREVKDILSFLRLVQSGSDFVSFERTINIPKRGFGSTTIEKLQEGALASNLPILSFCEALLSDLATQTVRLTAKQKSGLREYLNIIDHLRDISARGSLTDLLRATVDQTGYIDYLRLDPESFEDRRSNIDALMAKAQERVINEENPSLSSFLEELSLRSTLDDVDGQQSHVSLMTIHNGKGLEFTLVFLAGLEEQLFPHINSRDSEGGLEEERRLFYVGMTRAKEYLYLTHCRSRFMWGSTRDQWPSRFLKEIPFEYVEKFRTNLGYQRPRPSYGRY